MDKDRGKRVQSLGHHRRCYVHHRENEASSSPMKTSSLRKIHCQNCCDEKERPPQLPQLPHCCSDDEFDQRKSHDRHRCRHHHHSEHNNRHHRHHNHHHHHHEHRHDRVCHRHPSSTCPEYSHQRQSRQQDPPNDLNRNSHLSQKTNDTTSGSYSSSSTTTHNNQLLGMEDLFLPSSSPPVVNTRSSSRDRTMTTPTMSSSNHGNSHTRRQRRRSRASRSRAFKSMSSSTRLTQEIWVDGPLSQPSNTEVGTLEVRTLDRKDRSRDKVESRKGSTDNDSQTTEECIGGGGYCSEPESTVAAFPSSLKLEHFLKQLIAVMTDEEDGGKDLLTTSSNHSLGRIVKDVKDTESDKGTPTLGQPGVVVGVGTNRDGSKPSSSGYDSNEESDLHDCSPTARVDTASTSYSSSHHHQIKNLSLRERGGGGGELHHLSSSSLPSSPSRRPERKRDSIVSVQSQSSHQVTKCSFFPCCKLFKWLSVIDIVTLISDL